MSKKKNLPLLLLILDGWGIDEPNRGNAISIAKTPVFNNLYQNYPSTKLHAHGKYVGLPEGQVGNSEAGHMNIGAGRLVEQDVVKISKSIENGTFQKNPAFLGAVRHVKKMKSKFHIIGMLSNGMSPHSDPGHLHALLDLARQYKIKDVYLHLFTDGRDSPRFYAIKLIDELKKKLKSNEHIATVMGRFYAMDRKKKWSRTEKAYNALVSDEGRKAENARHAITEAYNRGESDEFVEPYIILNGHESRIEEGDSVIFFNLRSDRGRQLSKAFVQKEFNKMNAGSFKRKKILKHAYFVAMTDFGPDLDDIITAYPGVDLKKALPVVLSGYSQAYIAETEKYAHVTYFFNGGYSGVVANEKQYMIPSPDVKSYDQIPLMSSEKLTDYVIGNLQRGEEGGPKYEVTILNFAAPDMIGHTGNLKAGIECCEGIDILISKIIAAYLDNDGTIILTADHGNIEKMINLETEEIYTEHTTNQVPFIIINKKYKKNKIKLREGGILGDIAPTILDLLDVEKPKEMLGKSLIKR